MQPQAPGWDYLVVTAANQRQGAAYESQIGALRNAGALDQVRTAMVVADAGDKRVGSGGSTAQCLTEVIRRESARSGTQESALEILGRLRILIVHAGGDSRRLPAYSACGKIFVPLPDADRGAPFSSTLFDRLVPLFFRLPGDHRGRGQIVVASGDALILFDPSEACFCRPGITALGTRVSPAEASTHGVLCPGPDREVSVYLQKPAIEEQRRRGAIGADGRSVLDIGVMSMDASAATSLLDAMACPSVKAAITSHGIDLYREICCALGTDASSDQYIAEVRSSGSRVERAALAELFERLHMIPFHLSTLSHCHFLHFGSTRQLISSGVDLALHDRGNPPPHRLLCLSNAIQSGGCIAGAESWVEGCRIRAPLILEGWNVVVGIDVDEEFALPRRACLDESPGVGRSGRPVWFVRYYSIADTFKESLAEGATLCGLPLREWLREAGFDAADLWDAGTEECEQTLWNARVFPATDESSRYRDWRWMLDVRNATIEQKRNLRATDRYSSQEIALRIDHDAFLARRASIERALTNY